MFDHDDRKGKIYYLGHFPGRLPRLIKILHVYYDPAYHAKVFQGLTSDGHYELDKAVMLSYLREATPEEILLYWNHDV